MENFRTPQLQVLHHVIDLAKNWHRHQELVLREFNISHEQLNILIILYYDSCETSLSLLEIQNKMILPTTNTSRLVEKLKEKKLVTRRVDAKNRRKVKIQITKTGIEVVLKAVEKMKFYAKRLNSKITDQEAAFMSANLQEINEIILDWH